MKRRRRPNRKTTADAETCTLQKSRLKGGCSQDWLPH